jgi:uncharacterized protein (TIGR00255 family)
LALETLRNVEAPQSGSGVEVADKQYSPSETTRNKHDFQYVTERRSLASAHARATTSLGAIRRFRNMIRSMTAFARQEAELATGTITLELRSVNHRFLEMAVRLPEELRALEPTLRERAGKRVKRGKLDCNLRLCASLPETEALSIDEHLLGRVLSAVTSVGAQLEQVAPINPFDVLRWPGVLQEQATDSSSLQEQARNLFELALDELIATREREGAQIRELLLTRLTAMEPLLSALRERIPDIQQRVRERLTTRVSELTAALDENRLEQELVYLAQKMDVAEELDRLDGHIEEVRRVLRQREPVGRRLDFLMQEFNREANTLASKSADAETTRTSVELKVLIEQMREQVQNIE